jgi:hypothetical protein
MSKDTDKYTIHFWGPHQMVFTELGKTTLIFDKKLFLLKTREQLLKFMPEPDVDSHMTAFTYELLTGQLPRHNVEKYERVSHLMYEKVGNDEISLNAATEYSYDGTKNVNEVLEDCLTAVSSNSECLSGFNGSFTAEQLRILKLARRVT